MNKEVLLIFSSTSGYSLHYPENTTKTPTSNENGDWLYFPDEVSRFYQDKGYDPVICNLGGEIYMNNKYVNVSPVLLSILEIDDNFLLKKAQHCPALESDIPASNLKKMMLESALESPSASTMNVVQAWASFAIKACEKTFPSSSGPKQKQLQAYLNNMRGKGKGIAGARNSQSPANSMTFCQYS